MEHQGVTKNSEAKLDATSQHSARPKASPDRPSHSLHQLQRALGNRSLGQFVQAKLSVSQPDDVYEQEADHVADQVMRMPDPMTASDDAPPNIQRKYNSCESGGSCSSCSPEEEQNLQRKSLSTQITPLQRQANVEEKEEEDAILHTKTVSGKSATASPAVEIQIKGMNGGGAPLPQSTRSFFEPRFGRDLSDVRVHTDARAADSAESVNALAYTLGRNVVFGAGQFAPTTTAGQKLLAHELTHVLQQGSQDQMVQRFATCETTETCPPRDSGEEGRSRSTPHLIEDFASPTFGVLVSNFAVDERHTKPDLHRSLTWINLLAHIGLAANDEWEILGFSDCKGPESLNTTLRQNRADEVAALLPAPTRARVTAVSAAPIAECIGNNASESDRSLNRSVLIRRTAGSTGPVPPSPIPPVGPVIPPGAPTGFCVPYVGILGPAEAAADRAFLMGVWIPLVTTRFGGDVGLLWLDYLNRAKGASLAPRVFRGSGHPIVDAFRTDPETVLHRGLLFTEIATAAGQTPEATIPLSGLSSTSPPIPLGTLLPTTSLIRTINYTIPICAFPAISLAVPELSVQAAATRVRICGCLLAAFRLCALERLLARPKLRLLE